MIPVISTKFPTKLDTKAAPMLPVVNSFFSIFVLFLNETQCFTHDHTVLHFAPQPSATSSKSKTLCKVGIFIQVSKMAMSRPNI